jgi:hypothetical protein
MQKVLFLITMIAVLGAASISVEGQTGTEICVVSDQSGSRLVFNSQTGDYKYESGDGFAISGTGQVKNDGCFVSLEHTRSDGKVIASANICSNEAKALVDVAGTAGTRQESFSDPDTSNNGCTVVTDPVEVPPASQEVAIQDNTTGSFIVFNTVTGDYKFIRCSDETAIGGTGQIQKDGCTISLNDTRADRRIIASANLCDQTAKALIETFNGSTKPGQTATMQETLSDTNMRDNTIGDCPAAAQPVIKK